MIRSTRSTSATTEKTSDIKAQVIDPESGRSGDVYTYSVKEYADYLLARTEGNWSYKKVAPLVKTMLNYGAAAQVYFDKTSAGLANADLSAEDQTLGEITITKDVVHVTAIKGENAQAIGSGASGTCGTITIDPEANVTRDE